MNRPAGLTEIIHQFSDILRLAHPHDTGLLDKPSFRGGEIHR